MRQGVPLYAAEVGGAPVGQVTSGGFGPSVGAPVAMGLVEAGHADGPTLWGELRGRRLPVAIADLPFHRPRYVR
jgi:aminomethyltransferase